MKRYIVLLVALFSLAFTLEQLEFTYPDYFPEPVYDFTSNPLTSETAELGRMLFYDPVLSRDSTISCASCHSPYNAFAHTDHDLSHGIDDQIGNRNAPALFNLAWQTKFHWDGAVNHLDVQALAPLEHAAEMGESVSNVVDKLANTDYYPEHFNQAFGSSEITGERMLKALAQFQLSLVSANAKYDAIQRGEEEFSEQELKGYALFKNHCSTCHPAPLFTNYQFANNGLPLDTTLNDYGRSVVTQRPEDESKFKIPSLRNLSFSHPYMHDGRFRKLREVINHYSSGIESTNNLAPELSSSLNLNDHDRTDLVAFLLTLNDKEFVFNRKHGYLSAREEY